MTICCGPAKVPLPLLLLAAAEPSEGLDVVPPLLLLLSLPEGAASLTACPNEM